MSDKDHSLEQKLTEMLESDEQREDVSEEALRKISPRYEIRIQSEHDPVAEETKRYREIAEEVDDRCEKYGKSEGQKP